MSNSPAGVRGGVRTLVAAVLGVLLASAPALAASTTVTRAPSVIINEVNAANLTGAADEQGKRGDWIELFNTTSSPVDLTGWGLSNAAKNPFRWVFPQGTTIAARGYLRIWADKADRRTNPANLHTNFNIDQGADSAVLSAPNGTVTGQTVDSVSPPRTLADVSFGRLPNGDPTAPLVSLLGPTPGGANTGATASGQLAAPTLSRPSGIYSAGFTVTATASSAAQNAGAVLRYTTNGSRPTDRSTLVTGPIQVKSSSPVRVGAFKGGVLASPVTTATYAITDPAPLKGQRTLFVTLEPGDDWGFRVGYAAPSTGWRSHVEMLGPDGAVVFGGDAQAEDAGQSGSRNGQETLPLEINFKDAVGVKSAPAAIFSARPQVTSYKKLRLRNAGDDYQEAHLRDQYWQIAGAEGGLVPAEYEPVQVFLNGQYYGYMDLREKEDETLIESTFGVDKDDVEYLSDNKVLSGEQTKANFDALYAFITRNQMSDPAKYAELRTLFDVETFAQWFALNQFAVNRDWLWRNSHVYRMPSYDGRWRYRTHDVDIASDGTSAWQWLQDSSPTVDRSSNYTSGDQPSVIIRRLLENPGFKRLYLNTIADQLSSFLSPGEAQPLVDRLAAKLAPYLPAQISRNRNPSSIAKWQAEVAKLRSFITARLTPYLTQTAQYFSLSPTLQPVRVSVADRAMGTVKVNSVDLTSRLSASAPVWTGAYWKDVPVTLTAKPKVGFAFAGWSDGVQTASRPVTPGAPTVFTAKFKALSSVPAPTLSGVPSSATTLTTGTLVTLDVPARDPNGYPLTFSAKSLPSGLDIHPVTGRLYGKPTKAGTYASTITVSNGPSKTSVNVTFTVTNLLDRSVELPLIATGNGTGLRAVYSNDAVNGGTNAVTAIEAPALSKSASARVRPGFRSSGWSVRYAGTITAPVSGTYRITASIRSDDGVRIAIGGRPTLDAWTSGATTPTGSVELKAGVPTPITIDFWDKSGAASLSLSWLLPGATIPGPVTAGLFDPLPTTPAVR